MMSLSQPCKQFLKHCLFELQVTPCQELFKPLLTSHGVCCVFNSPYRMQNMKIVRDVNFHPRFPRRWGAFSGLTVLTDHAVHDALEHTLLNAGAIRVNSQELFN
ncbi:hypothetical protein EVAR_91515_1 [Eumeta japonica]|uniref:Uncharacterized protein n=1 Tax=Eumeta variegata TaxID=151549 RepID=A0A4C1VDE1_EUMVA|nr:hypothetical protein EVAR_91515_1 [Eumeta japonica]